MSLITANQWQQAEYECFKDPHVCLLGWCCPCCVMLKNAKDLGENVGLCCLLGCCCPLAAIFLLRKKARETYSIDGSPAMDALCTCCLPSCVNCQTMSETRHRNQTIGTMPSW